MTKYFLADVFRRLQEKKKMFESAACCSIRQYFSGDKVISELPLASVSRRGLVQPFI